MNQHYEVVTQKFAATLAAAGARFAVQCGTVIEFTHFMTKAMATPSRLAQAVRDPVIPLVSRVAPFQHAVVQRLTQLDIAYRGSPIVEGAGQRYFDDRLRGTCRCFLLALGKDAEASELEEAQQLCRSLSNVVELATWANSRSNVGASGWLHCL